MGRGELNRNPGAYLGVTPTTPPNLVTSTRPPTTKDYRGFSIGDLWLDTNLQDLFILVSKAGLTSQQEGTWLTLGGQAGNVNDFETDDGNIVVPNAGRVNVFGGSNMNTTGAIASTITINLNDFITWPATNAAGDEGVIYIDGQSVLHTYDAVNSPSHNLFAGEAAGNFTLTTAEENVGLGTLSLASLTTGDDNVGVGYNTLSLLENGIRNVAINSNALGNAVSTEDCIAIGKDALVGATVNTKSIAIGTQASAAGNGFTIAIGTNAMLLNINPVGQNVAIGDSIMVSSVDSEHTTAVGSGSVLGSIVSGNENTAFGFGVLNNLIDGDRNTAIGAGAGSSYNLVESDNILIGNDGVVGDSNTIRIGSEGGGAFQQNATFVAGIYNTTGLTSTRNVVVDANGQLGTGGSDGTPNAFFAYLPADETITGQLFDVDYSLGATLALTEVFDDGGNFFPGDGIGAAATFTAPSDGKYLFNWYFTASRSTGIGTIQVNPIGIVPSSGNAIKGTGTASTGGPSGVFPALLSLTTGDTVEFHYIQSPNSFQDTTVFGGITDIRAGFYPSYTTWVSGWQVSS